jgi:hypothetical protein
LFAIASRNSFRIDPWFAHGDRDDRAFSLAGHGTRWQTGDICGQCSGPKESFSRPPALKPQKSPQGHADKKIEAASGKKAAGAVPPAKPNDDKAAVQFTFPTTPGQFDVTQETRFIDVNHDGKTGRQEVQVITVVVR